MARVTPRNPARAKREPRGRQASRGKGGPRGTSYAPQPSSRKARAARPSGLAGEGGTPWHELRPATQLAQSASREAVRPRGGRGDPVARVTPRNPARAKREPRGRQASRGKGGPRGTSYAPQPSSRKARAARPSGLAGEGGTRRALLDGGGAPPSVNSPWQSCRSVPRPCAAAGGR